MTPAPVHIRFLQPDDLPRVAGIYHHYVAHSTCTFDTEPRSEDRWRAWLAEHGERTPATGAIVAGELVGWASLSSWNNRCAYRFSAEDSVYVHPSHLGHGIGRALLADLVRRADALGIENIIAQIADHQAASERLHAALCFRQVGCLEKIGYKFDRWIDVSIWQRRKP